MDLRAEQAIQLMTRFAERTGLTSERTPRRYLWTDAFAVCNFLAIARATGDERHRELALRLVDRVHQTLGRHRGDDGRAGWISGLSESEGRSHPTRGGLRIGKKLPERRPVEPFDQQLEWERDGQYFHYLTKWMHALDQLWRATHRLEFSLWARELAQAAYAAFSYLPAGSRRRRLVWKMSIDLSRSLVSSMGHHDALDGFITCAQLRASAPRSAAGRGGPSLDLELASFASMLEGADRMTTDLLGIGGLLSDAFRVEQLIEQGEPSLDWLPHDLLAAALDGLRDHAAQGELQRPASSRLAFRELGLSIGLHGIELMGGRGSAGTDLARLLEDFQPYVSMAADIESFWMMPEHRQTQTWLTHQDINEGMLATSLLPQGYLILSPMDKEVIC